MINDMDYYSDLNPSNSKHILDALHNLLKDLNIKNLFSSGEGGGGPDPDFLPYMYLLIDTDEKSGVTVRPNQVKINFLSSNDAQIFSEKIDNHNNDLVYPKKGKMIEEKNKMIRPNYFLGYNFESPYDITFIHYEGKDLSSFMHCFKKNILHDVEDYNNLLLCKFYYESENKDLLSNKFKDL
jgi:hypothetical protein